MKKLVGALGLVGILAVAVLYAQEPARFERGIEVIRGNIILGGGAGNRFCMEGATADAFELCLAAADVTADVVYTFPLAGAVDVAMMVSTLTTNSVDVVNSVWGVSNGVVFEGATANAFEITIAPADVTADVTLTLPLSNAAAAAFVVSDLTTNSPEVANSVWGRSNAWVFEGLTADAFETILSPSDVTADVTLTIPLNGAVAGAFVLSTLTTNSVDVANSIWLSSNAINLEGLTADAFETIIQPSDVTADVTLTIPLHSGAAGAFVLSTLTTNSSEVVNSIWLATDNIIFEGSVADASETFITITNATADRTLTIPDSSGTVMWINTAQTVSAAHTVTADGISFTGAVLAGASPFVFEGATADLSELTLAIPDVTADVTYTVPGMTNVSAAFMASTLTTNNVDAASSIWFVSNGIVFEGATADANETTVSFTDPAADGTLTFTFAGQAAGEQLQTDGAGVLTWEAAGSQAKNKFLHGPMSPSDALAAILSARVYRFHYRPDAEMSTGDLKTEYVGVLAEEASWAMHHNGKIVNPVNTLGYTVGAIQALEARIAALEHAGTP